MTQPKSTLCRKLIKILSKKTLVILVIIGFQIILDIQMYTVILISFMNVKKISITEELNQACKCIIKILHQTKPMGKSIYYRWCNYKKCCRKYSWSPLKKWWCLIQFYFKDIELYKWLLLANTFLTTQN